MNFERKLRSVLWIVILIVGTSVGCNKIENQNIKQSENIKLPTHLTAETADLQIKGEGIGPEELFLDLKTIRLFPPCSFKTVDPWDQKKHQFTGVRLLDLLNHVGLDKSVGYIEVIATNGYKIPIKVRDLEQYEYTLAYMIDGEPLDKFETLSIKGKLIIAINFDKHKDIDIDIYKNQLVWQVKTIHLHR